MKTKYDVLGLIKTLDQGEKRHFKLFAKVYEKEGDKNILRLYDVLERMKKYDEEKIYKKLGDAKFLTHLHAYKKKLYDAIMKSLRNYHSADNTNEWLYDSLKDVRLLLKKNLISDADHLLKKARKLAEEKENHFVLFEINKWQRNITTQTATLDEMEQFAQKLYLQQHQNLNNIGQIIETSALSMRAWLLYRKYGWPAPKNIKEHYKTLISEAEGFLGANAPLLARIYAREILGRSNRAIENYNQSLTEYQLLLQVFKSNSVFMADHLSEYVTCVSNLLYLSTALHKNNLTDELLNELKDLPAKFPYHITTQVERRVFETVYNALLTRNNELGQFTKSLEVIPIVEQGLKRFEGTVAKAIQADFYFNCALSHFLLKNYAQALQWVNKYINDPESEAVKSIDIAMHILTLIIHAQLGNVDYVSSYTAVIKRKHPAEASNATRIGALVQLIEKYTHENSSGKQQLLNKYITETQSGAVAETEKAILDILLIKYWTN